MNFKKDNQEEDENEGLIIQKGKPTDYFILIIEVTIIYSFLSFCQIMHTKKDMILCIRLRLISYIFFIDF